MYLLQSKVIYLIKINTILTIAELNRENLMENVFYESLKYSDPSLPLIFHFDKIMKDDYFLSHWHENIEILYVIKGNIIVFTDQERVFVSENELAVINSGNLHKIITEDEFAEYYCLIADKKMCEEFSINVGEIYFKSVVNDEKAVIIYNKIVLEFEKKELYFKTALKAAVIELMVCLTRYHTIKNLPMAEKPSGTKTGIVKEAIKYIQHNYSKNISTSDISAALGVSKAYFCRIFKEMTGSTAVFYINSLRCQKAKMLIQSGNCLASEAAFKSGFENLSYFTKTYKKHIGHMPSKTNLQSL